MGGWGFSVGVKRLRSSTFTTLTVILWRVRWAAELNQTDHGCKLGGRCFFLPLSLARLVLGPVLLKESAQFFLS